MLRRQSAACVLDSSSRFSRTDQLLRRSTQPGFTWVAVRGDGLVCLTQQLRALHVCVYLAYSCLAQHGNSVKWQRERIAGVGFRGGRFHQSAAAKRME